MSLVQVKETFLERKIRLAGKRRSATIAKQKMIEDKKRQILEK